MAHWTETYTFENRVTKEQKTAEELYKVPAYARELRRAKFSLISVTLRDAVRFDDGSIWDRVR